MAKRLLFFCVLFLGSVAVRGESNEMSRMLMPLQQIDKKTEIDANLRQAKYMMERNNFAGAKKRLDRVLELDPSNNEANRLIGECKIKLEQIRNKEFAEYKEVCKKNTVSALRAFIEEHPNSEFRKDAENRIKDFELWNDAKEKNTIEAYNAYLQKSVISAYKGDAQHAIQKIKEERAWNACKNTDNEALLEDFISTYPESSFIEEANYNLNLLKGERLYKEGLSDMAYSYFNNANLYRPLIGDAAAHYAELKEKMTFNEIIASSDVDEVRKYLNTLSFSSPYYNDTSNHLALLLGEKLSAWSSDYSMGEALNYAKDEPTKATVRNYINQAKDLRRAYERQRKARARKEWWSERVSLGWKIANLGANVGGNDPSLAHLGTGLRLRFGRYSDFMNIILGADYQYYYMKYEKRTSNNEFYIHQGIGGANIRFNLFNAFSNAKFYIGCAGHFTFYLSGKDIPDDALNKSPIVIDPQIGIQGRGLDIGIYYRTFTDKNGLFKYNVVDNNHVGFSITWYFLK